MSIPEDQLRFKTGIKRWLKSQGLNYKWMADQCGVSEITVRNWMAQKTIPVLKQQLIQRAIAQSPRFSDSARQHQVTSLGVQVDATLTLTIKLSPDLYGRLEAKGARRNQTVEEIVAQTISALLEEGDNPPINIKKVTLPPHP